MSIPIEKEEAAAHAEDVEAIPTSVGMVAIEATGEVIPDNYYQTWSFIGTIAALVFAALTSYFFVILSTNILSYINADIGPSTLISWVSVGRTLGVTVGYSLIGRLSDIFGRRWFFIGGNGIAIVGIIIAASAMSVPQLIVGAVVYGVGESTQFSFPFAIGELIKNKHRPVVTSLMFGSCAPIATFGSLIARKFVQHPNLGWRYCFYLAIVCNGIAIILLFFCYHPPTFRMLHMEGKTKLQQFKELDFGGIVLMTAGIVLLLLGISWGGVQYPWNSARPIATIVFGTLLLIAFGFYEIFMPLQYPLVPPRLFADRGYWSLVLCVTVASMFYYSVLILWPQQISDLYTKDIIYGGYLTMTTGGASAFGQLLAGIFMLLFKRVRIQIIISAIGMVGFIAALAVLTPNNKDLGVAFTILGCLCVGYIELAALAIAPLFCAPEDIGLAVSFVGAIRSLGGSISVTVYTAILNNRLGSTLPAAIYPAAKAAGYTGTLPAIVAAAKAGNFAKLPGASKQVIAAVTAVLPGAYAAAFRTVYLASLAFGGVALIGAALSKDPRKHLTDNVHRKLHGRDIKVVDDVKGAI